jgi:hypothetical protein
MQYFPRLLSRAFRLGYFALNVPETIFQKTNGYIKNREKNIFVNWKVMSLNQRECFENKSCNNNTRCGTDSCNIMH